MFDGAKKINFNDGCSALRAVKKATAPFRRGKSVAAFDLDLTHILSMYLLYATGGRENYKMVRGASEYFA